jgi:hypothetical protein
MFIGSVDLCLSEILARVLQVNPDHALETVQSFYLIDQAKARSMSLYQNSGILNMIQLSLKNANGEGERLAVIHIHDDPTTASQMVLDAAQPHSTPLSRQSSKMVSTHHRARMPVKLSPSSGEVGWMQTLDGFFEVDLSESFHEIYATFTPKQLGRMLGGVVGLASSRWWWVVVPG